MKICSICHKISGTDDDHLDCMEKKRIELADEDFKQKIPEKLDLIKNESEMDVGVKAVLEYLTKEKEKK